jgi:hypothetical protein
MHAALLENAKPTLGSRGKSEITSKRSGTVGESAYVGGVHILALRVAKRD